MDRLPTLNDVAQCYRLFLERDVEDGAIAVGQLAGVPTLWELIHRFANSTEASRRRIHRASGLIGAWYDPAAVDVTASEAAHAQLMALTLARWERCGRGFAYDRLFRDPRLFDARSAKWNRGKQFEIGDEEVERLCAAGRRNGIAFAPDATVLALGCQVEFVAAAASQRLGGCLGVEADGDALRTRPTAVERPEAAGAAVVSLRAFLEAPPDDAARFDIFHSTMLLQHAPPPVALALLDHCLARIHPGGHAYFQLPCHIYDYRYETDAYLRACPQSDDSGEIHALPQVHVLRLLDRHGLVPIEILPDPRLGPMGFSFTFLARKRR